MMQSAKSSRPTPEPSPLWGTVPAARWMHNLRQKSPHTYDHCVRVALLSERLAIRMKLPPEARTRLLHGGFLHDLGKLLLPDSLLQASGPLTASQQRMWRLHPELGAEILESDGGVDEETISIVRFHHEHWDGNGYPGEKKGAQIPYLARICAVIDTFDNMMAWPSVRTEAYFRHVCSELADQSGKQFDGQIVRALLELLEDESYLYIRE